MKLVKLNRRHSAHKDLGHNWAFRWDSYDSKAVPQVEKIMHDMHGSQYAYYNHYPTWKACFGHATRGNNGYRPYWISFKNEADATVVLLQVS